MWRYVWMCQKSGMPFFWAIGTVLAVCQLRLIACQLGITEKDWPALVDYCAHPLYVLGWLYGWCIVATLAGGVLLIVHIAGVF